MKIRKYGLVLLSFLVLSMGAGFLQASQKKSPKWFGEVEYYLPGDAKDDVEKDLTETLDDYHSDGIPSDGIISETNGLGGRLGVMFPFGVSGFEIGGSMGYLSAPSIEGTLRDYEVGFSGTLKNEVDVSYLRAMLELNKQFRLGKKSSFILGGGIGVAKGKLEQKRTGTGFYSNQGQSSSDSVTGLSWEISPALGFNFKRFEWEIGVKFSDLPSFKRTDKTFAHDWSPAGLYTALRF